MASTYTDGLAVEIIGSGDKAGSWGDVTNNNLKAFQTVRQPTRIVQREDLLLSSGLVRLPPAPTIP